MDSVIQKLVEEYGLVVDLAGLAYLTYLVRVSTDALMWLLKYKRCDSDITRVFYLIFLCISRNYA